MRLTLQSSLKKRLLVGACMLAPAIYIGLVSMQYAASYFSQRPDLVSLQRAVRLQRGNAEYRYQLGTSRVDGSPQAALESYAAAVTLNPHKARYWLALAAVYQSMG